MPPVQIKTVWIHLLFALGLVLLVSGFLLSHFLRSAESVSLAIGEHEQMPSGIVIELLDSSAVYQATGNGRERQLRNWTSTVRVHAPGQPAKTGTTRVNAPLTIQHYRLYQSGWTQRPALRLESTLLNGHSVLLAEQEGFQADGSLWILHHESSQGEESTPPRLDDFFFLEYADGRVVGRKSVSEAAAAINMEASATNNKIISDLSLRWDPGTMPAIIGAMLLACSAALAFVKETRHA